MIRTVLRAAGAGLAAGAGAAVTFIVADVLTETAALDRLRATLTARNAPPALAPTPADVHAVVAAATAHTRHAAELDQLEDETAARWAAHLAGCATCRGEG